MEVNNFNSAGEMWGLVKPEPSSQPFLMSLSDTLYIANPDSSHEQNKSRRRKDGFLFYVSYWEQFEPLNCRDYSM